MLNDFENLNEMDNLEKYKLAKLTPEKTGRQKNPFTRAEIENLKYSFLYWALRNQMVPVLYKLFLKTEKQDNYPILY